MPAGRPPKKSTPTRSSAKAKAKPAPKATLKATPPAKAKPKAKPAPKPKASPAPRVTSAPKAAAAPSTTALTMPWAPDAVGLARVRPGFGKTPEDDVLFALGYPHIVVPTDEPEPKHARDPSKVWKVFPRTSTTHVPRSILPYVYGYHRNHNEAEELFAGPPPTYDAAKEMKSMFARGERLLFFLEAMLGSEVVATAAVDHLSSRPVSAWKARELDESGWNGIRDLGFVLLRVSPATHAALVARLEAVFKKVTAAQGKEWWRPVEALDVVLHGRAGLERSGDRWCDVAHARDDHRFAEGRALATLSGLKPTDRAPFDTQIAFVSGPRVVTAMKDLKKFFSELHADAKRQLARIAD